ncbi:MAG: hypothetical protein UW43_C0006G0013 [Candidatus Yanofskybacteria bacterium GW2011_GWA1_44_21]|uniref:CARDB domain-containing protein n=2 Tax=Candidatus Yanofskyibacteriota TaxID=1752733 RepID=A0A1F8H372_9BACT|nr:MAG: hypothetical protein UW14_C0008G0044 [Candidatus Yanofskybacteria bacterium GW2011_GWA2_44_10]KKT50456.1 MAG: hypothetical protein UW43_C0006G0013 [Candidatus Yanofskybacteria bacterium GW2011_GWA1_44_21]KKT90243.1 MAG: hypothetical protein UW90_C0004G0051 [Candidatus Yanofskybacteria bacterium GW2011_GWB1_45_11]OGN03244.1 MAG: hypothetical protein A2657_01195 [Candidatus Yanofskybacteria bacterium RIFCSPHIGHO2_01_FULL_44_110b]OGN18489.1 MAG: hypothetical protein A3F50_01960 [Candidatus
MGRFLKQIVFGLVYLVIFLAVGYGIYYSSIDRPSCGDGIQNGKEEGIDCGTLACAKTCEEAIKPLVVNNINFHSSIEPEAIYEILIEINNPNPQYAVKSGVYELAITDVNGSVVKKREYSIYMLPGQTRYFGHIEDIDVGLVGEKADVKIKSVDWVKSGDFPSGVFITKRESLPVNGQTFYEAVITNNSDYDFDNVDVIVFVSDNAGDFVSVNTTNLQTFLAKTDRSIKVDWPYSFSSGYRFEIQVTTNIFDNANYIKSHGTQEQFQKYY